MLGENLVSVLPTPWNGERSLTCWAIMAFRKAGTYRDTVSVEPGSTTVFVSVSVSKRQFLGIEGSKDTFS